MVIVILVLGAVHAVIDTRACAVLARRMAPVAVTLVVLILHGTAGVDAFIVIEIEVRITG